MNSTRALQDQDQNELLPQDGMESNMGMIKQRAQSARWRGRGREGRGGAQDQNSMAWRIQAGKIQVGCLSLSPTRLTLFINRWDGSRCIFNFRFIARCPTTKFYHQRDNPLRSFSGRRFGMDLCC